MSSIDLDQWPQYASANDVGVETRVEMLRRRVAAYRCYLVAGTDINIVRQILREIAIDHIAVNVVDDTFLSERHSRRRRITADQMELTLTDKDGKDWDFKVDPTAKIQLNDKEGKLDELKENDEVTVKYSKQGAKFTATEIKAERK